jgi:hypothetical protein
MREMTCMRALMSARGLACTALSNRNSCLLNADAICAVCYLAI